MLDHPLLESVLDIWLIWSAGMAISCVLIYRCIANVKLSSIRSFWRSEEGASYALPYVLTFPWILLLTAVIIQCTLILLVKFGTVYAAYASARSVIVWQTSDPVNDDKNRSNTQYHADRAALLAMTPFASGYEDHLERVYPGLLARAVTSNKLPTAGAQTIILDRFLRLYRGTYTRLASSNKSGETSKVIKVPNALLNDNYVRNKLVYASLATDVKIPDSNVAWNQDTEVKIRYLMHLHIPGAARMLSKDGGGPWYWPKYSAREITTTVALPSEAPETSDGKLNVPYFPSFMTRYFGI